MLWKTGRGQVLVKFSNQTAGAALVRGHRVRQAALVVKWRLSAVCGVERCGARGERILREDLRVCLGEAR